MTPGHSGLRPFIMPDFHFALRADDTSVRKCIFEHGDGEFYGLFECAARLWREPV